MKRLIGIAILLAVAAMALPSTSEAVSVTFNWPDGAWGFWEISGITGGRVYNAGKTVEFTDNTTYTIYGDGWGTSLKIQIADGVASILENTDNVGIVDNEDNTFTWVAATFNVVWQRRSTWSGSAPRSGKSREAATVRMPARATFR